MVHPVLDIGEFLFERAGIPEGVDLVNEPCHSGPFAEEFPHIGKFDMAVRIDKSGSKDSVEEVLFSRRIVADPGTDNRAVILDFDKSIEDRFAILQREQVFRCYSFHLSNQLSLCAYAGRRSCPWSRSQP